MLLVSFLLLAIAGWFLGRWPAKRWSETIAGLLALCVVGMCVVAPNSFVTPEVPKNILIGDVDTLKALPAFRGNDWQPWSADGVQKYQAQGRPVFVDFTASWCLWCQVNERVALDTPEVEKAFADDHVVLLRADWTRYDDSITQALTSLGRSGVPTYALYVPGESKPGAA